VNALPWARLRRLIDTLVQAEVANALSGGHGVRKVQDARDELEEHIQMKERRLHELVVQNAQVTHRARR
jgi:exoribonuclease R